jgi:uncharacterized protein YdhG (YjbR/CyaY superfamily)
MAKTDFKSVDDYIATHPAEVQKVLQRVRSTIRKALPDAQETISYQIPAYKQHGGAVIYFAGWKEHFSIYPASTELVAAVGDELAGHVVSKGTIRFPLGEPVPTQLIARIARFREKEALALRQAKAVKSAKDAKAPKAAVTKAKAAKSQAKATKRMATKGKATKRRARQ